MELLKEASFARAMNLLFSLEDNLRDGPIENPRAHQMFERLVFDFLARFNYDHGYVHYDYDHRVINVKIWTVYPADILNIAFNTVECSFSITSPTMERNNQLFYQRLKNIFRSEIDLDPNGIYIKFLMEKL